MNQSEADRYWMKQANDARAIPPPSWQRKADAPDLQEPRLPTERARLGGVGPSPDLAGWLLWLYVGLILATLVALIAPPVYRWLAPLVKP